MPQMSPLSWLTMFMTFSTLMLMIMMILYTTNPQKNSKLKPKHKMMNMKSKW